MQRLEVSGAVRPIYVSLDVKRLIYQTFVHYPVSNVAISLTYDTKAIH